MIYWIRATRTGAPNVYVKVEAADILEAVAKAAEKIARFGVSDGEISFYGAVPKPGGRGHVVIGGGR